MGRMHPLAQRSLKIERFGFSLSLSLSTWEKLEKKDRWHCAATQLRATLCKPLGLLIPLAKILSFWQSVQKHFVFLVCCFLQIWSSKQSRKPFTVIPTAWSMWRWWHSPHAGSHLYNNARAAPNNFCRSCCSWYMNQMFCKWRSRSWWQRHGWWLAGGSLVKSSDQLWSADHTCTPPVEAVSVGVSSVSAWDGSASSSTIKIWKKIYEDLEELRKTTWCFDDFTKWLNLVQPLEPPWNENSRCKDVQRTSLGRLLHQCLSQLNSSTMLIIDPTMRSRTWLVTPTYGTHHCPSGSEFSCFGFCRGFDPNVKRIAGWFLR